MSRGYIICQEVISLTRPTKHSDTDGDVDEVDPEDTRAVTIVVLLATPGVDFKGGHFEVELGGKKSRVSLQAGDAIGFPAKRLYHRVTKVSRTRRYSMIE